MDGAVHFIRTFADLKLREEITEESDKVTVVRYNPLGVVVCIVPWNFPILIAVGKNCIRYTHGQHGPCEAITVYSGEWAQTC